MSCRRSQNVRKHSLNITPTEAKLARGVLARAIGDAEAAASVGLTDPETAQRCRLRAEMLRRVLGELARAAQKIEKETSE